MRYSIIAFLFAWFLLPFVGAQPRGNSQNDPNAIQGLHTSVGVIIGVILTVVIFISLFSFFIIHCSNIHDDHQQQGPNPIRNIGRSAGNNGQGLDAALLHTAFPTLEYSTVKGLKIGKGALECAVCLCEFENDETLRLIPKCDHVFHVDCIDMWFQSHTTCPVCRANLVPGPDESVHRPEIDIEAQNDAVEQPEIQERVVAVAGSSSTELEVSQLRKSLNRSRTRGSRRLFQRSVSLLQPGENTERFTLRLPARVRKEIIERQLERSRSLLVLPRENSRGGRLGRKSERWNFTASFSNRLWSSFKSPKVDEND
ncbi:E3 ubiquitin-protein ligase ATL6 [Cannabis sativa]|uniref:RING-type E3 ubiquitin transferase n=1 Tax=Cannabis sativa TaxID=3483 RepID=A0A7J6IB96_CANSA|nr:E3 ubiquitin-protein ligase ATL6 [Cannabis sativa]KAF4404455.1 hypothetical protein G4B88_014911 [Cannabis sativa]